MTIDEVLTYYEHKQSNVADSLGIERALVHRWWKKKYVPYDKQCVLEIHTKGKLKASKYHDPNYVLKLKLSS